MTARAVRDAAMRWIADDPDPVTAAELHGILAAAMAGTPGADDALADRMAEPLRFGTAGLRGPVRAGPAGMNVAVVRRTTAGLAEWLRRNGHGGATVVVGRDARYGSAAFAAAAAGVLGAAGFDVVALPGTSPTPLLAHAVRAAGAAAGVQLTASHNPKADNGYKVYLADGAQLVPPADAEIEELAAAAGAAVAIPADGPVREADAAPAYLERVAALPRGTARTLRIALTPLHGVGGATAVHALALAGFTDVRVVASQAVPDPEFPTVPSPNPEHPGATDALLALAADVGADLAMALDPDADRCALGVPGRDGRWRMLSGDETGVLLGDHLLRTGDRPDPLVSTTVVSSSMLRAVAAAHGARFAETLTGFKWIVRAGAGLVYGYEEAIGYCVDPDAVRDKDGIATAVVAADLAATLRAAGSTLLDRLDSLYATHGVHLTRGLTRPLDGGPPAVFGTPPDGWAVTRPAADVLVLHRGEPGAGDRVVVRPSGTEPILKTYLQVVERPDPDVAAAMVRAAARLDALEATVRAWR